MKNNTLTAVLPLLAYMRPGDTRKHPAALRGTIVLAYSAAGKIEKELQNLGQRLHDNVRETLLYT